MSSFIENNSKLFAVAQQLINNEYNIYVKVDKIDFGSYETKPNDQLIVCVGPKNSFRGYPHEFTPKDSVTKVWSFPYKNQLRASIVVALYKAKFFGGNIDLGKIEISLSALERNKVTKNSFKLRSENTEKPIIVDLSIHLNEDESAAFDAPTTTKLESGYQIIRKEGLYC